ncbi:MULTISPECIES: hypothetical protein [Okeania]|uniref:hypothetical protein n=1 Tax=Okeania TaxID=1458928 RepID=UPI000F540051|nr:MULTISPECIES: hypothetical protein [Okeania]NET20510.1 hypothetical protein [Okeania sp. SIO1H5]NET78710.1 hypothetical protein [Okeania sp. SIO1F9]NET93677.1 hypothetical protein [Okeania sp. SIO1H2]
MSQKVPISRIIITNITNFAKKARMSPEKGINSKICGRAKNNIKKLTKFIILEISSLSPLYSFGVRSTFLLSLFETNNFGTLSS